MGSSKKCGGDILVDFVRRAVMDLLSIHCDGERCIENPTLSQLTETLGRLRDGTNRMDRTNYDQCVECGVRLPGDIEGALEFLRVNDAVDGQFLGWLVRLSTDDECDSFLLALMESSPESRRVHTTEIELLGYLECVDHRCVLSQAEILEWISREFGSVATAPSRYRWVDFMLALDGE
ncbi:MAG: hypothetical protein IT423_14400 [Pirellulaceae bacterium]|nr:hypothetical protein [Pirellulaceae bacterium]